MSKIFIKVITFVFLAFFASISAFAMNSEYKNTLTNVDLVKTSENSYTINLYTSKKYSAPIKVIKKSDLSYYILLPETKNISPKINPSSSDIRSINTTLYPYAGVDVNNGYTKVDINTTKPINFTVSTRSASQRSADLAKLASNAQTKEQNIQKKVQETPKADVSKIEKVKETPKVQKPQTNLAQNNNTQTNSTQTINKKEVKKQVSVPNQTKTIVASKEKTTVKEKTAVKTAKTTKTDIKENAKKNSKESGIKQAKNDNVPKTKTVKNTQKPTIKKDTQPVISRKIAQKLAKITSEQQVIKNQRIEEAIVPEVQEEIAPDAMAAAKINSSETENNIDSNKEELTEEKILEEEILAQPELVEETEPTKTVVSRNIDVKGWFTSLISGIKSASSNTSSALSNKLYEYGLTVFDLMFMIFAGIFSFIAVIFIMSKRQNQQPKLKNKSEFVENVAPSLVPKKENNETNKDDAKYFVFENNVKQTGLTVPAELQEKKNYELVSYDPDIRVNPTQVKEDTNEDLDIIQKILKDDDFVDIQEQNEQEKEPINEVINETTDDVVGTVEDINDNNEVIENNDIEDNNVSEEQVMVKEETKIETAVAEEPIVKQTESVAPAATSPIGLEHVQQLPKEEIVQNPDEPRLLASYNISPEHGFMFISYNYNISLMGFIFDDVFVLHDFKTAQLPNYNLQFRLVDKDEKSNIYIVKTDSAKLLVKVGRTSMNTELVL